MTAPKTELDEKLRAFGVDCRRRVAGELRDDLYSRVLYSTDASLYQLMPHAVLIPRVAEDVIAAMALAAEYGLPVLPRAAGTSLAGQAVNEALVIDFSRHLDAVVAIDPEARRATVQPGVVLDHLNAALRPHGLRFGPDPASSDRSTLGGAVANNATGSHSLRYGMTADHVIGMTVVMADGRVATLGEEAPEEVGGWEIEELQIRDAPPAPVSPAPPLPFSPAPPGGRPAMVIPEIEAIRRLASDPTNARVIRENTPHYWRRCGGYNLYRLLPDAPFNPARLVCGSEGTLAVMTEITVGLVPRPPHAALALLHFDDLYAALSAVPALLEMAPSAVELLDNLSLALCREVPEYARLLASVVEGRPYCLLVVEFEAESEAAARAGIDRLAGRVRREALGVTGLTTALTPAAQSAVWAVRKAGLGLLMSLRGDMKPVPFIEDAAVPVAELPAYVRRIEEYCAGLGAPITYYAHAGAGCLHIRPLINRRSARAIANMPDIARFAAGLVKGYGGALSSEHGDGRSRSWLNEAFYGPALYDLFRQVKRIFDPHNRLNPGIIVDAGPMTDHLRPVAVDREAARLSFVDYEQSGAQGGNGEGEKGGGGMGMDSQSLISNTPLSEATGREISPGGFARAVEMCNGAGVCRRLGRGTMCPSFMVTREEEHSTRGRANALRAAMAGVLPPEALTSPRMYAVMDLCISCKACKAECPSAVDMARLKTEFLARYYEVHGVPRRARFFGHSAALLRLGSGPPAPLAGAALRSAAGRRLAARLLGLAPERPLPVPARRSFAAWWRERETGSAGVLSGLPGSPAPRPPFSPAPPDEVALVIDPFTNYVHPQVGIAAVELLAALDVRVVAAPVINDGRAFLSKGLVREARRAAGRAVAALAPLAERGLPLVGLEPSSLLTLRDEALYLLPDDPRVRAVAERALTFEEFVAGLAAERDLRDRFTRECRRVLLHGHCHQKALVGTGPARAALSLPAGYEVEEVDSGCCGMAGSFGYEVEHYALSMQMAERRLLPAVRSAAPATIIAAAGVSCREQIAHGSGRLALHPAEVLRDALRERDNSGRGVGSDLAVD